MRIDIDPAVVREIDEVKRAVQILTGTRCSYRKASKIYSQIKRGYKSKLIRQILGVLG